MRTNFWDVVPNCTGFDVPPVLFVGPELAAGTVVRDFARGKAHIVPARRIRFYLRLMAITPPQVRRIIWARLGRRMREGQLADRPVTTSPR